MLKSFMHRRNNSDGTGLPTAALTPPTFPQIGPRPSCDEMRMPNYTRRPAALGEIQNTRVDVPPGPRSPSRRFEQPTGVTSATTSPTKPFRAVSLRPIDTQDQVKAPNDLDQDANGSPTKFKKPKSTTNLIGLLSRPKSSKNLQKFGNDNDGSIRRGKENRSPTSSVSTPRVEERPPIYAQFSSGALEQHNGLGMSGKNAQSKESLANDSMRSDGSNATNKKPRPKSYHVQYTAKQEEKQASETKPGYGSVKALQSRTQRGLEVLTTAFSAPKAEQSPVEPNEFTLDPKDVDKHLEAMLDRRNIPENQRYKMRNLADTIKMEFIRQDWAETNMANGRPSLQESDSSLAERRERGSYKDKEKRDGSAKPKKSRGMSFTLSRNSGKKSEPNSPTKKTKGEGTLGRHFRTKSTESVASERPSSSGSLSASTGGGILSKIKLQQGPADFVTYLRKVQKPELVEVGKLHKLRLLLRNETVSWTDEFVRQGGMEEIVGLLHRIMDVEWREEHEDALLHETLLCLKALCTTGLALQYLHSIQATLFPALLHLLFDPEKKGPSEFTTRNIVTSILFTYIQSAALEDRVVRARTVLGHLHDPQPKEEERPVGFVLEMRRERPYRIWCKEAVSVTKEVFWIFLHHLNIVYLPREKERGYLANNEAPKTSMEYLQAHFPQERPPVPAAPYVGGVEWDATNYLASHLDLLNAILACTPTLEERNKLRELLRISGWERCMGGSLRLCKEKFYPGVHDALRTWVAAAAEDGWDVRDVRYGPPPEPKSPSKNGGNKGKKEEAPPPKIEIPKLDFILDTPAIGGGVKKANDDWLS